MTRRDFLARLGLAASAVALSPMLDLAPIVEAPSAVLIENEFVAYFTYSFKLLCDNPRSCGIITDIGL